MLWRRAVMLEIPFPDSYGRLHLIASLSGCGFGHPPLLLLVTLSGSSLALTMHLCASFENNYVFQIQAAIGPPMLSSRAHLVLGT